MFKSALSMDAEKGVDGLRDLIERRCAARDRNVGDLEEDEGEAECRTSLTTRSRSGCDSAEGHEGDKKKERTEQETEPLDRKRVSSHQRNAGEQ